MCHSYLTNVIPLKFNSEALNYLESPHQEKTGVKTKEIPDKFLKHEIFENDEKRERSHQPAHSKCLNIFILKGRRTFGLSHALHRPFLLNNEQ